MRGINLLFLLVQTTFLSNAQNVGIGTKVDDKEAGKKFLIRGLMFVELK